MTATYQQTLTRIAELLDVAITDFELDGEALHERYDEFLNETFEDPKVACASMEPAQFLRREDPTAYNCGYNDWLDGELKDGSLIELDDCIFDREALDELKEELAEQVRDL
jgi:hypothetical protein